MQTGRIPRPGPDTALSPQLGASGSSLLCAHVQVCIREGPPRDPSRDLKLPSFVTVTPYIRQHLKAASVSLVWEYTRGY